MEEEYQAYQSGVLLELDELAEIKAILSQCHERYDFIPQSSRRQLSGRLLESRRSSTEKQGLSNKLSQRNLVYQQQGFLSGER